MAEKRFVQLDRHIQWYARIPIIFRNNPLNKAEFFEKMTRVKMLIADGRTVKTEGRACKVMEEAFVIVTELFDQVNLSKYLWQGLMWLLVTFVGGFLAALAALWLAGMTGT